MLVRTVARASTARSRSSWSASPCSTTAARRPSGRWRHDRHVADAAGAGQTIGCSTDMLLGIEGGRARGRHTLRQGEQVYCALSLERDDRDGHDVEEASAQLEATTRFWRDWLGARPHP